EKLDQRLLARKSDFTEPREKPASSDKRNTRPLQTPPSEPSPSRTGPLNQNRTISTYISLTSDELTVMRSMKSAEDEVAEDQDDFRSDTEIDEEAGIEGLYEQLLHLTSETPMLMKIVAADLEMKQPIDMLFLNELKVAVDNLRKVIYRLTKISNQAE